MRTTKLLPILATTIAAGLLFLATTTSNAAIAQTSAASIISQLNKQARDCLSGTTTSLSCNQAASNTNLGNAVSAAGSDPSGSTAFSGIFQGNIQKGFTLSGGSTTGSGNQAASNFNNGTAVSAAGGF